MLKNKFMLSVTCYLFPYKRKFATRFGFNELFFTDSVSLLRLCFYTINDVQQGD